MFKAILGYFSKKKITTTEEAPSPTASQVIPKSAQKATTINVRPASSIELSTGDMIKYLNDYNNSLEREGQTDLLGTLSIEQLQSFIQKSARKGYNMRNNSRDTETDEVANLYYAELIAGEMLAKKIEKEADHLERNTNLLTKQAFDQETSRINKLVNFLYENTREADAAENLINRLTQMREDYGIHQRNSLSSNQHNQTARGTNRPNVRSRS